jgi:hypothetical protein
MKYFLTLFCLFMTQSVLAWGPTGHRVVGEVATQYLNSKTLKKVEAILEGQSLARVSTWSDEIKSDPENYKYTFNWHYTTWSTDDHDHSEHQETSSTGFLLKSIREQLDVLKDRKASREKKEFALKFIVHLVGDLHMPLHVGTGSDQGGNFCKVTFMGRPTNLHALWDEGMISFAGLSFTELARFVTEDKSQADIKLARQGTIIDWALESKKIVPTLYPTEVVTSTTPVSIKTYCKKEVLPEEMPQLSYEYSYRFMPVLNQRLFEGGIRLAKLLNENLK